MSEEATQTEATAETKNTQAQSADLTIQDLNAMKSIIDVASSRGAFKPNEMMTIGQVYMKLEAFLEAVAAQQKAAKEA